MAALATDGTIETTIVTEPDRSRLRRLIDAMLPYAHGNRAHLAALGDKLIRARVVPPAEVPTDVVTMSSRFRLRHLDSEAEETRMLVFPHQDDGSPDRLSVVDPLGVAVLGRRVGDLFERPTPGGVRPLVVDELLFQPERARDPDT